jgi:putative ABC transport system permease protein
VGTIIRLAFQSLRSRAFTSLLTVASIALSVTLLVGIEHVRAGVRESFAGTIRGVDLIVGARGGTLQILLSSVFGIGAPAGSVRMETYERWAAHPAVSWTIPYSLGDSHRGYRVIGTTSAFYERYRYRQDGRVTFAAGGPAVKETDVVIGAEVAERLRYTVGSPIVVTHGLQGGGIADHDAHPFTIVGVLNRTFTPIDRAIYVTLEGIEAMHEDFEALPVAPPPAIGTPIEGAPSAPSAPSAPPTPPAEAIAHDHDDDHDHDDEASAHGGADDHADHDHAPSQISAFFVGTKNRFEALQLQRDMNTDLTEPLTAVIPGVALGELWQNIASAEVGLRIVALFAVAIGLTGMLVALYASLDARRREMAILRAVGAGPRTIVTLLVFESALLALLGCVLGVVFVYGILALGQGAIEARSGVHLALRALGPTEWQYLALVLGSGTLIGFVPALKAYRNSLSDGLAPRS